MLKNSKGKKNFFSIIKSVATVFYCLIFDVLIEVLEVNHTREPKTMEVDSSWTQIYWSYSGLRKILLKLISVKCNKTKDWALVQNTALVIYIKVVKLG